VSGRKVGVPGGHIDVLVTEQFLHWFHEIYTGTKSLRTIVEDFSWSNEYQIMYPSSLTNDQFVGQIYQNLFDRSPDQGGWDYWSLIHHQK